MPIVASILWGVVICVWLYRGWVLKRNGVRPSAWFAVFVFIGCGGLIVSLTRIFSSPLTVSDVGLYVNMGLALILFVSSFFAHRL